MTQLVNKFPVFIEPENSLPCSQELATGPCPELEEPNSQFLTLFLQHLS